MAACGKPSDQRVPTSRRYASASDDEADKVARLDQHRGRHA
jgi:hypothetical protein